jgi:uncharacterized caspase-like protein/glucan-binding YG repeat protein
MGKYALLIGIDTYGEGLHPLPAASKDVVALQEVLLNPEMGSFDEARPLINPTQPEMAREIELWLQDRQPEDLMLLFFSGHGVKDDRRDLYFAAANTEKVRDRLVRATATSARFLHDCIRGCKAKYQVLILDCCFSGAFGDLIGKDDGEIPLKEQLGSEGRVVLTSTSSVDYAFEEKDADLSIYTRYLVEGIATGAADEDSDGMITIDELHRYAGRKVKETSPTMSPCLITLKDEGFRIRVARSPQDDPRLKYRKEAERRATAAEFTIPAQRLLIRLRAELDLSEAEAEAIEAEVLKPHREYQRKRQEYQDTLRQCLERELPLSQRTINDLKDYRAHLRLKPEDVAAIERAALNGHDLEGYVAELQRQRQAQAQQQAEAQRRQQEQAEAERQQRKAEAERKRQAEAEARRQRKEAEQEKQAEAERQRLAAVNLRKQVTTPTSPAQPDQDDLSSERFGANYYAKLRDLLAAQDWKAADRETADRMCEVMNRQKAGWLKVEDVEKFPCLDLRNIDRLWVKYSQGKFGFSVQKEIWQSCGSPTEYNKSWYRFGAAVGWRTKGFLGMGGEWMLYSQLTFDLAAPRGHLPVRFGRFFGGGKGGIEGGLFSVLSLLSRQDL